MADIPFEKEYIFDPVELLQRKKNNEVILTRVHLYLFPGEDDMEFAIMGVTENLTPEIKNSLYHLKGKKRTVLELFLKSIYEQRYQAVILNIHHYGL